jgi:glutamine synthetase
MPKYSPEEVLSLIEQEGVQYVDLRFSDLFGQWQHLTIPAYCLSLPLKRVEALMAPP